MVIAGRMFELARKVNSLRFRPLPVANLSIKATRAFLTCEITQSAAYCNRHSPLLGAIPPRHSGPSGAGRIQFMRCVVQPYACCSNLCSNAGLCSSARMPLVFSSEAKRPPMALSSSNVPFSMIRP